MSGIQACKRSSGVQMFHSDVDETKDLIGEKDEAQNNDDI